MEKQNLNKFISRYNLNKLVESVKWESTGTKLKTSFISDDKSVLGSVQMDGFELDKSEFGVYDTSKLSKMLGVLGNDINFSITNVSDKNVSLKLKDESTSVNYMLADLSVIPNVPELKQLPEFDVEIKLDQTFISKFIRAKSALDDENNFTFIAKNGKKEIILGYSNSNTNRISIDVDCTSPAEVSPISFSSTYLKEILVANKEATDAVLKISTKGLAHIHFEVENYVSDYYLVEVAG